MEDEQPTTTVIEPAAPEQPASAPAPEVPAAAAQPEVNQPADPAPEQPDLEQLLARAREEERAKLLAEQAEAKAREEAERAEAERQAAEAAEEEKRRAALSDAERAKLEADEARREAAEAKAAREAAEAEAERTKARNAMLRGLVDSGQQLQADTAVEDLAFERVQAKLAAGKSVADALTELRSESPWLFKATEQRPPTNVGGHPGGRATTVPQQPTQPKKFDAMKASPAELRQRMRELAEEQRASNRRN